MSDQADGLRRLVRSRVGETAASSFASEAEAMRRTEPERRDLRMPGVLTAIAVRWSRAFRPRRRSVADRADYSISS